MNAGIPAAIKAAYHTNEAIHLHEVRCLEHGCLSHAEVVWTHTDNQGNIGIHGWCYPHSPVQKPN